MPPGLRFCGAAFLGLLFIVPDCASRWLESWGGAWSELGKLPQILRDGREQELVLSPPRAAQS